MAQTLPDLRPRTDRSGQPGFAKTPILEQWIREALPWVLDLRPTSRMADLGAGVAVPVAKALKEAFPDAIVTAVDLQFPEERTPILHTPSGTILLAQELPRACTLITASNVLNVQRTPEELSELVGHVAQRLRGGGYFLANYPSDPRTKGLPSTNKLESILNQHFGTVLRYQKRTGGGWMQLNEDEVSPRAFERRPVFLAQL